MFNEGVFYDFIRVIVLGDIVLIKYFFNVFVEKIVWGEIIFFIYDYGIVLIDFWGIGDIFMRKFVKISGVEYMKIFDVIREIKIIKIGFGVVLYGEVFEDIVFMYELQNFLRNYYFIFSRIFRFFWKFKYVVVFGFFYYIYFNFEKVLKLILIVVGIILVGDFVIISFVNISILNEVYIGIFEEFSIKVVEVFGGKIIVVGGERI